MPKTRAGELPGSPLPVSVRTANKLKALRPLPVSVRTANKVCEASTAVEEEVNEDQESEIFFPHLRYSPAELNEKYPSLVVPDEVDAGDPQADAQDPLLAAGMRRASELTAACAHAGRKRRM